MSLQLNDVTNFFNKLQSSTINNNGGMPNDYLSNEELDHAITLIQANTGTVDHTEGKAKLLGFLSNNFDAESSNGYITSDSLAKSLRMAASPDRDGWA